jgi:hypothetical protein
MIFPSLRSPPRQGREDDSHIRPYWFLRIFKTGRPNHQKEPSYGKSRDDLEGSQVERRVDLAAQ